MEYACDIFIKITKGYNTNLLCPRMALLLQYERVCLWCILKAKRLQRRLKPGVNINRSSERKKYEEKTPGRPINRLDPEFYCNKLVH